MQKNWKILLLTLFSLSVYQSNVWPSNAVSLKNIWGKTDHENIKVYLTKEYAHQHVNVRIVIPKISEELKDLPYCGLLLFGADDEFISHGQLAPANTAPDPIGERETAWEYQLVLNPDIAHAPTLKIDSTHDSTDLNLANCIVKESETKDRARMREHREYIDSLKAFPYKCFQRLEGEREEDYFPIYEETAVEALSSLFSGCDSAVVSGAELGDKKVTMNISEKSKWKIFNLILLLYNVRVLQENNQLVVVPTPNAKPKEDRYLKYSELTNKIRHNQAGDGNSITASPPLRASPLR